MLGLRLRQTAVRVRWRRALRQAVRAALLVHVVLGPWLLLRGLLPLSASGYAAWLLGAASVGALAGWVAPLRLSVAARLLDQRLGLKDRISSALEVTGSKRRPMADALLCDAAQAAEGVSVASAFPLSLPPQTGHLAMAVSVCTVLLLLPPPPLAPFFGRSAGRSAQERPSRQPGPAPASSGHRDDGGAAPEPSAQDAAHREALQESRRSGSNAPFRDSAIDAGEPDFASFLQAGDDKLRLLALTASLPDLSGDDPHDAREGRASGAGGTLNAEPRGRLSTLSARELERALKDLEQVSSGARGERRGDGGLPPRADQARRGRPDRVREADGGRGAERLSEEEAVWGASGERAPNPGLGFDDPVGEAEARAGQAERGDGGRPGSGPRPGHAPSQQARGLPTPRIETRKLDTSLAGDPEGAAAESSPTTLGGPGAPASSPLPYLAILTRYRRMAEEALSKERVPFEYREQVKRYFDALERRR